MNVAGIACNHLNSFPIPVCPRPSIPASPRLEVVKDFVTELASSRMRQDTSLPEEWLSEHIGVATVIAKRPGFARYLNRNPDQVEKLMQGPGEARQVIKEAAIKGAQILTHDASPITDEWLDEHRGAAMFLAKHPGFAAYLNRNTEQAKRFMEGPEEAKAVIKEASLEIAGALIDDDSPITDDWLAEHPGAAAILVRNPGLTRYLNEKPEQAERLMEGPEEAGEVIKEAALEGACALMDDDSPITDEWLSKHMGTAFFLAKHPGFASYLNKNPEEAGKFIGAKG
jgi:hypothetical protein